MIILEFGTVFRRSRRGCGIQRTPGDKVIVEKQNKKCITGCAHVGGVIPKGGALSSVLYGNILMSLYKNRDNQGSTRYHVRQQNAYDTRPLLRILTRTAVRVPPGYIRRIRDER